MAHAYSHLYRLPTTGLRFFTVYGPWGRPDMAPFLFAKKILGGEPIEVFNNGDHSRDFTFVDDIVEGVIRASDQIASPSSLWNGLSPSPQVSNAPFRIFNLGNSQPVKLMDFIKAIEDCSGKKAVLTLKPLQPGDVVDTFADVSELAAAVGYRPSTTVQAGVRAFIDWYVAYYGDSR
jgi:UDP-glucuronate 4-epimerase